MIEVSCPHCQQSFEISDEFVGRHGRCDHCQTKFLLTPTEAKSALQVGLPFEPVKPKKSGKGVGILCAVIGLATAGLYVYQQASQSDASPSSGAEGGNKAQSKPKASSDTVHATGSIVNSAGIPPLETSFPVKTTFEPIDIRAYKRTYPNVHQGWMPSKKEQAAEAKTWGNHLGPLGVRIRSHVPQLQRRAAFSANVPQCLRSKDGKLALTAAEVVSIAPGSPAENHLKVGDLIIGIEGEELKSGNAYRPDWDFMHKDVRELQLMLGEKIDQAQARGDIRLTVLRYSVQSREVFAKKIRPEDGRVATKKIPVTAGETIELVVDPQGPNDFDQLSWLSPILMTDDGQKLDLTDKEIIQPTHAETGWGKIREGREVSGRDLGEKGFGVHGFSKMSFLVPEGYSFFQTAMKAHNRKGDLKAIIQVKEKQEPLPVTSRGLWVGVGGDKSVGAQSFDVEVPGDGYITLVTDKFDEAIRGDSSLWLDVMVEGEYGSQALLSLPNIYNKAGYKRAKFVTDKPTKYAGKNYAQSLDLHAHGMVKWRLPNGTKRVKGTFAAVSYGKVQPRIRYTNLARPLTGVHKDQVVEIRFPIGKTGSYGSTYPKDCSKSELAAARHADWLAAQQRSDGTWPRLAGYTTSGWDTAWCGLALMSSGNPKYDEQVKKAAYWVAYEDVPSDWVAERAMRVIFLAEYYLRTKDQAILAGLQSAYVQVVACAKTDYMSGHKVNGFGYGIVGQHYGTGHLALAVAMASRTPISVDQELVSGIIRHAGEVCVNGTYAYGRGRRMARNDKRRHGGGNAMLGPGILGVMIGGGHSQSVQEALERWSASIGDGDNSHATSSLAFTFASLAMSIGDEEVFLKHMQNFRYKMTLDDNWEGGILKSAFPLDFQGGESVTSNWIRSAGSILVLNALKKNLTITGKREHFAKDSIETQAVSEWGGQIHSYYVRNWCLAKELLGGKVPPEIEKEIEQGITEMEALPRTTALVPGVRDIVIQRAPQLTKTISRISSLTDTQRAYAIELLCGLDFRIFTAVDGKTQNVDLRVNHPLNQLNWLDENKEDLLKNRDFILQSSIEIDGDNLQKPISYSANSGKGFNADSGELKKKLKVALKNPALTEFKGKAKISFKVGDTAVTYTRPLWFNSEFSHSNNINLRRLNLRLKVAPRAYFQSQPLIIAGRAFDCMYPAERMLEVKGPEQGVVNIHEGDAVLVNLASENFICPWVLSMTFPKMTQVRVATAKDHRVIVGSATGDWSGVYDFHLDTGCELRPSNKKSIIELDYGKPITLNGLDVGFRSNSLIRIWYKNGDQWVPLVWDRYTPHTSFNPRFPDTTAQQWRVELRHRRATKLSTLRFYYNPNRIAPQPTYIQCKQPGTYPDIKPN